jgi:hypothetical protein
MVPECMKWNDRRTLTTIHRKSSLQEPDMLIGLVDNVTAIHQIIERSFLAGFSVRIRDATALFALSSYLIIQPFEVNPFEPIYFWEARHERPVAIYIVNQSYDFDVPCEISL